MEFITPFFMWLFLVVLPNIGTLCEIITFMALVGLIVAVVFGIPIVTDTLVTVETYKKIIKYLSITFICSAITTCCIPDKKELAAIILIPTIVHNEQVQNIGNSPLQVLQGYLDAYIEEFKPKSKE